MDQILRPLEKAITRGKLNADDFEKYKKKIKAAWEVFKLLGIDNECMVLVDTFANLQKKLVDKLFHRLAEENYVDSDLFFEDVKILMNVAKLMAPVSTSDEEEANEEHEETDEAETVEARSKYPIVKFIKMGRSGFKTFVDEFDADNNGKISKDELFGKLKSETENVLEVSDVNEIYEQVAEVFPWLKAKDIESLWQHFDKNEDGEISVSELILGIGEIIKDVIDLSAQQIKSGEGEFFNKEAFEALKATFKSMGDKILNAKREAFNAKMAEEDARYEELLAAEEEAAEEAPAEEEPAEEEE